MRLSCALGLGGVLAAALASRLANSVTLYSDLLRACGDFLTILLVWLTVRKVGRGSTYRFNYGYGKLENVSALIVALVMVISWAVIAVAALGRLRTPVIVTGVETGLVFNVIALVINGMSWRRTGRIARRSPSPMMESQWRLFRTKAVANALVALSLALSLTGWRGTAYVDPIVSLAVSGFLLFTAWSLSSSSISGLMDRALEETVQLVVMGELADFFDRYTAFHGMRSRRSGGTLYIEISLQFDGALRMSAVQRTIDEMRDSLERKIRQSRVAIVPATRPIELG